MVALLLLTGCQQGEGESCQVNGDCESGLICCKDSPVATPVDWGVCMTQEDCDAVPDVTTDGEEDTTVADTPEDTAVADTPEDTGEDTFVEDTVVEDTAPDPADDPVEEDPAADPGTDDAATE